jgi:hypothetical protein
MTNSATKQQEVHIDLPGEIVKCWRSGDNLKVVLRKHRDVIFDINLDKEKTYTVQATHSDFYNARDKKLVYAKQKGTVSFKDGERMHVWVTRGFQGALLLKSEGKLLMKIEPNRLDSHQYNEDPKTKAAPIIVKLGDTTHTPPAVPLESANQQTVHQSVAKSASAPIDEACPVVCVVEGTLKNAPETVLSWFKKGGGTSGLADIDPNDVATRNWLLGQLAGTAAYARDNWSWLRASIDSKTSQGLKIVKAQVHMVRGKVRFYFSGYSKFNKVFGPGGFGPGHDRIISIFAGVGKTSSSFKAVGQGILGSVKGNALISFIFSSATAYAEWKDDLSKDGYDLTSALLMGLVKTIIVAAMTVAVVAILIVTIIALSSAAIPVLAVGAITVFIGVGIGYIVDAADRFAGRAITGDKNNSDGLSSVISPYLRVAGKEIESSWRYLMDKFPNDYKEIFF